MIKAPPTPKGFRDIKPEMAKKRREVINKIASVLEEFNFVPIETPTIEFAETLKGKYGEEERLIYEFTDRGGRKLALRYDLTVPLARYTATYNPPLPFRRYQVGQVFRGENPQKGRFREFTQFDFDTVGLTAEADSSIIEDALVIAAAIKAARDIGLDKTIMAINDRRNFSDIPPEAIRAFDKLNKIGMDGVKAEILNNNYSSEDFEKFKFLITTGKKSAALGKLLAILKKEYGLTENQDFFFDPTLARGLDYYTSTIFELKPSADPKSLSIGGGGRYDNLIGMFSKKDTPAVGFSFGLDRLLEILV
ncbi:MAG: ATP phosphoribosyltransferase regulatory subunit [Patescibacteria group bacterium]